MGLLVVILVVAVAGALAFLFFRSFWPKVYAWILSDREEKAALTRLKGHYNANGYLVSSESDFRLSGTGSFKRFESVDSDGIAEIATGPVVIPPQPLRPAPPRPPSPPPQQQEEGGGGVMCVEPTTPGLKRAISCDSVCSDSSVGPLDLVSSYISGYLCIGIDYDSECGDLIVSVIEAKDLVCKELGDVTMLLDTYVCLYLLPEKAAIMQTRTYRGSNSPSFKEKFLFGVEWKDWGRSSLMFHVYAAHRDANTLVGEAQLLLSDVPTKQPITTWLTLADSNQSECSLGEILFSLSYLPTAERLTVVVVKARNLKLTNHQAEPFVKVYLLRNGKKVHKKKTSYKRGDPSPIFNEAMIFSVPNHLLHILQIRVSVVESHGSGNEEVTLGHVIIGGDAEGKALSHWSQMLISLRKPVAMWHPLLSKNSLP